MTDPKPAEIVALAADQLIGSQPAPRDRAIAELLNYAAATWDDQHGFIRDHLLAVARHTTAGIRDAARQASGQQPDSAEDVPTPEEGIEDARKAMQHVLQLFLDRVPRDELDAETMADSLADALSDGLTELYRTAAQATPAAGPDAAQLANDTETSTWWTIQAQKPTGSWFDLSAGFSSADEVRTWRDTELTGPKNWPLRIVQVQQTETVIVEEDEAR
jgi:hypothetical protein